MSWYTQVFFILGLLDAALAMLGGIMCAFVMLMGWDARALWERLIPAGGIIILSNLAAGLILAATRWMIGG